MIRNKSFGELVALPTAVSNFKSKRNSIQTISDVQSNNVSTRLGGSIKKSTGKETSMGDYTIAPGNMFDL